jgi:hypothetical protein
MAIPSFGGMTIAILTVFVVPVLYCFAEEVRLQRRLRKAGADAEATEQNEPQTTE